MSKILGVVLALTLAASAQPAFACQSGEKTYYATGTTSQGVEYVAVRVNWDTGRILLRRPNGDWVLEGPTPGSFDPGALEAYVETLLQRQVSEVC